CHATAVAGGARSPTYLRRAVLAVAAPSVARFSALSSRFRWRDTMNTHARPTGADLDAWPALPLDAWRDTYATLHMWTQIVGKVRTTLSPPVNHWWHSTFYVTARGLTTSPIPY